MTMELITWSRSGSVDVWGSTVFRLVVIVVTLPIGICEMNLYLDNSDNIDSALTKLCIFLTVIDFYYSMSFDHLRLPGLTLGQS